MNSLELTLEGLGIGRIWGLGGNCRGREVEWLSRMEEQRVVNFASKYLYIFPIGQKLDQLDWCTRAARQIPRPSVAFQSRYDLTLTFTDTS